MQRPYLGIELQAMYPGNAVVAIVKHGWGVRAAPRGGFRMLMRALLPVWYVGGT